MKLSYHCEVERADRVQHIVKEIGLGQVVREKYCKSIEDVAASRPGTYTCITDTGITLIKSEDKQTVITMYVTTFRELVKVYNGTKNIPTYLHKRVDRNQSFFTNKGKTIWR